MDDSTRGRRGEVPGAPSPVAYPWPPPDKVREKDRDRPRKRIWVPHVDSELRALWLRTDLALAQADARDATVPAPGTTSATTGTTAEERRILADGIKDLISRAVNAAHRRDPVPGRILNWWRGTLVEQTYHNLHMARAQIIDLLPEEEVNAEIPGVVARVHATLHPDDTRRVSQQQLYLQPLADRRAWTRRLMEDGYEALDYRHARLRNFRNIVLGAAIVIILLLTATCVYVTLHPSDVPLCFAEVTASGAPVASAGTVLNCPTGSGVAAPSGGDVLVVALLGLLGGALAATVSIRKLGGSDGAYDVPVALAWLKVPLGALTAILGLLALRGQFVPGLTNLDSQEQILAYAVLFGFAQQAFTSVLDRKAGDLVDALPTKDSQPGGSAAPEKLFPPPSTKDGGDAAAEQAGGAQAGGVTPPKEAPSGRGAARTGPRARRPAGA
ncbi:hypothetical protein ATJ88_2811 [Isoptericola jiangsuensis]|uniref:Uncharacterized protein n=1 Tax=Isoptericola jiangsuensis TaxID=548579 RepID=A0A2A9EZB2_9MICO|nr:hypothetical protein [Isoptericola jiangsuensis]PFG44093.1 hypothetical protein ATJ88_2811 [Isoptericola jiangsuensis]